MTWGDLASYVWMVPPEMWLAMALTAQEQAVETWIIVGYRYTIIRQKVKKK